MLSPPAAAFIINLVEAAAGGSASPASQSTLAADWKRLVASAPPLLAVTGQGAVGDGELVSIHDVQAYRIAGCQNGWGGLGSLIGALARLGWLALRPLLREAPPGRCFDAPGAGSLPNRWSWAVERSVGTRGKGALPLALFD